MFLCKLLVHLLHNSYNTFLSLRSPDGTCLLTCSNDNKLRLFNLPEVLYSKLPDDDQLLEIVSIIVHIKVNFSLK